MPASYAYLGPEGTFTEVALRTLPEAATRELIPYVSVQSALDAVRVGEAEAAFVPIENSVEGGITTTLDELVAGAPLMIYREVLLSITFALLVRPGTELTDIKTVSAHPAAQPQVRNWLKTHLPDAHWESAASNADAARLVQEGQYDAAFAGEFADEGMDRSLGSNVDALGRFIKDKDLRLRRQPFADDDLLLIAPGQGTYRHGKSGSAQVETLGIFPCKSKLLRRAQET